MEKLIEPLPWKGPCPCLPPEPLRTWESLGVAADVLRLDRIHPDWGGNKWFKLRHHLTAAKRLGASTLVSFGGIYSNHLWALASAGKAWGWQTKAFLTGHPPSTNPLMEKGMSCVFVSRGEFEDHSKIQSKWEQAGEYWIPMGGSGLLGIKGAATILNEVDLRPYSHIICATGTGTMAIGLATQILTHQVVWGLPVLKNWALAEEQKFRFLPVERQKNLVWKNRDNMGRYGKAQPALLDFMNQWQAQTSIETDFIYTGKLFWAVDQMIKEEELEKGSKILVVHSGGLAGNRSLPQGSLRF